MEILFVNKYSSITGLIWSITYSLEEKLEIESWMHARVIWILENYKPFFKRILTEAILAWVHQNEIWFCSIPKLSDNINLKKYVCTVNLSDDD